MSDGKATARACETGPATPSLDMATPSLRPVMDVVVWCTVIADAPVTLVLTADSVARDTQAQRDQEALLLAYLQITQPGDV